jgi:TubC N-terminal docking domain
MTGRELLQDLGARGIAVTNEGGTLRCMVPPDVLDDEMRALLRAHKAELLAALAEQQQGEDDKKYPSLSPETVKRRKGRPADALTASAGAGEETFSPTISRPFHGEHDENGADEPIPIALPSVHDAHDPHAVPSVPCATCGNPTWRAESREWRWQWVCGQCRPTPSGGDAARPRTAAELIATLPHAPCHGGCGRLTPHAWECLSCRTSVGESAS